MFLTTLIDTKTLASQLGNPELVIVDCRFKLEDESWGQREYRAQHIPGAVYAHLAARSVRADDRRERPSPHP